MPQDPSDLREDLLRVAEDFTRVVRSARRDELDTPTNGTRWSNRQLLFHLVLGQNVARTAIPLIGIFSRLPDPVARGWSRLLRSCTVPYNGVNWAGSAAAGQLLSPDAMTRMMDRTTTSITAWYDRADEEALGRGMWVPPSWDPYFQPWMTRRDLLAWAPQHYRHHRRQLTLTTLDPAPP